MGSMSFLLPNPLPPVAEALLRQACFAGGYDQTPVPCRVELTDRRLVITRHESESGYLLVPWPVDPIGARVTTTSTLRERSEPYNLILELARGKLNQVRTQTAEWQGLGLQTEEAFDRELTDATRLFGQAVLDQGTPAAEATSTRVIERSYDLADQLTRTYIDQMFGTRAQDEGRLNTQLSARYVRPPVGDHVAEYRRAFNAARIGFRWRDLEPVEAGYAWDLADEAFTFARTAELPATAGPVIDLSPGMLPDWAAGWSGDLPTLAAFMCDFLETLIGRYKATVRRWVVCAGFNHSDGLNLSDDDRLRLAARLFEAAAQVDPEIELVLGIAQPWGDYMADEEQTISPLSFADDLVRAGSRISAIELELRNGSGPRGSLPRDLLDTSRLLDLFGVLGLPLEVVVSTPATSGPDLRAAEHLETVWSPGWATGPRPEGQADWGEAFAALALCKPHVRSVTWSHWSDADPHLTPHGGLHDPAGHTRPLLARLASLRTEYLL